FAPEVIAALAAAGHEVEEVGPFEAYMGHAGALVRDARGVILGAADPRGEGVVAAF
ncbi:MAG: gamma-glutamyltransferase, partial [Alphaproteobacteria bacterium]|nr:gamma-glutamyltransferase [Alphaproteobacteria bacterium]